MIRRSIQAVVFAFVAVTMVLVAWGCTTVESQVTTTTAPGGATTTIVLAVPPGFQLPPGQQFPPGVNTTVVNTSIPANSPGTIPGGDQVPSCSLFPTRLAAGAWFFTNRRDFPITLRIVTTSTGGLTGPIGTETVVFDGTLGPLQSTPVFTLTPDTAITWAGGTYHLTAYDFVNCLEEEGPTPSTVPGTTPPSTTPFTVPGTTPSTVPTTPPTTPFSVPTTVPPTVPATTTPTVPPSSTPLTVPATVPVTYPVTYTVPPPPSRPPLANTGNPPWVPFAGAAGVLLVLLGGVLVLRTRGRL